MDSTDLNECQNILFLKHALMNAVVDIIFKIIGHIITSDSLWDMCTFCSQYSSVCYRHIWIWERMDWNRSFIASDAVNGPKRDRQMAPIWQISRPDGQQRKPLSIDARWHSSNHVGRTTQREKGIGLETIMWCIYVCMHVCICVCLCTSTCIRVSCLRECM